MRDFLQRWWFGCLVAIAVFATGVTGCGELSDTIDTIVAGEQEPAEPDGDITAPEDPTDPLTPDGPAEEVAMSAELLARPVTGTAPLTVTFQLEASAGSNTYLSNFRWDFGDGHVREDTAQNASTAKKNVEVSYVYDEPGDYEASVIVTDNKGQAKKATRTIHVNSKPVAKLTVALPRNTAPSTARLDASASYDPDGKISSYTWHIADSGGILYTTNGPNKSVIDYTFTKGGEYSVVVTTVDNSGASSSQEQKVSLAELTVSPTSLDLGTAGTTATFNIINSGTASMPFSIATKFADGAQPWLTVSPITGTSGPGEEVAVSVTADRTKLSPGGSSTEVEVISNNAVRTVVVSIAVVAAAASVDLLDFGTTTRSMLVDVWNAGSGLLEYRVTGAPQWLTVNGGAGTSSGPEDRKTISFEVDRLGLAPGDYSAQVQVVPVDTTIGSSHTITVQMTVTASAGLAVNAGPDQPIVLPTNSTSLSGQVLLDGTPAPTSTVTTWSKVSGPGTVTFSSASSQTTTVAFSQPGTYVLQLRATYGLSAASDTITVYVVPATTIQASASSGEAPLTVNFTAMQGSTIAGNLPPGSSLRWLEGSTVIGNGTQLTRTFASAGSYVIKLALVMGSFNVACQEMTVNVSQPYQPGVLTVDPAAGLSSIGTVGGPFSPASITYTLTNTGGAALNWTTTKTRSWTAIDRTSGTLAAGASTTVTVSIASGAASLAAGNYDDTVTFTNTTNGDGNTARPVSLVVDSAVISTTNWQNFSFAPQTGTFTAEFDATPNENNISSNIGLSAAAGSSYASFACLIGFSNSGYFDIRDGGVYRADVLMPYTAGQTYHVRMVVNVPARTYSVYITPAGGAEVAVATNYAFRTEQNQVTQLANWGTVASDGSHRVANFSVSGSAALPGVLSVSPAGGLSSTGQQGGPFSPASTSYTLSNTGGEPINWTAGKTQAWTSLSKTSGTLAAGATDTVTVSIIANANSLAAGTYSDTVTFTNTTNGSGSTTRSVSLQVTAPGPGVLSVTPAGGLNSAGPQGGPFAPSSVTYTLTNSGATSISWTASKGQSWVTLSKTGGTLAPGASDTVTTSIDSGAGSLAVNSYSDTVIFTNTTNGNGNTTRAVSLTVNPVSSGGLPMTTASRTSGVAPLGVFFDAVDTVSPTWSSNVVQPRGFVTQPANCRGVRITRVNYNNQLGTGTLSYTASSNTLRWAAPGGTAGTAVNVSSGGTFDLPSGSAVLHVWVNPAQLPTSNASDSITVVNGGLNADWASFHYEWDFGDPGSGHWATGARKSDGTYPSRNIAFGWNAAHVYEQPGTYTATLRVIDDVNGQHVYTQQVHVLAEPPGGWKTYYFAASGNDTIGNGSQASPYRSWEKAQSLAGPNVRLLFRRGDTFTFAGEWYPRFDGAFEIAAYGVGERPIFTTSASVPFIGLSGVPDSRLIDLQVVGPWPDNTSPQTAIAMGPHSLALRCRIQQMNYAFGMNAGAPKIIQDCDMINNCDYAVFAGTDDLWTAYLGCTMTDANQEWLFRNYGMKQVLAHTEFARQMTTKGMARFMNGDWVVAAFNRFSESRSSQVFALLNDDDAEFERHVLVLGNEFDNSAGTATMIAIALHNVRNVAIVNNRMHSNSSPLSAVAVNGGSISAAGNVREAHNVQIVGNTVAYTGTEWSRFLSFSSALADVSNVMCRGNIFYAPNVTASSWAVHTQAYNPSIYLDSDQNCWWIPRVTMMFGGPAGTLTFSGWRMLGQDGLSKNADPRLRSPGAGDVRLLVGSPCIDAGWFYPTDADQEPRRTPPEIGAIEYR